ncbi:glycosyltransferase family 39 protein [Thermogemmatispora carboxidivorans]|uniref:glycosyltransferase family 39 protein n=1 Tax=Thermogemmatispora carboxidivorans TaxID=1382306 RepID=UPI0012DCA3C8|nr:glycosyltransferase family 39 protein [Thermogemmatispora carboxidivorans]
MTYPTTPLAQGYTKKESGLTEPSSESLPVFFVLLLGMALMVLGLILPLRALYFYQAFPGSWVEHWLLLPTRLLFPHQPLVSPRHLLDAQTLHNVPLNWHDLLALGGGLALVCLLYLLALRALPPLVSYRFILLSTAFLGFILVLYPALTSQDVFSYITYARIGVIYHLNPLTTLPVAISQDPIYQYIFWTTQPSAYGPTWIACTSLLQWLALQLHHSSVWSMVLLLRLFGLAMHLGATILLWSGSGLALAPQEVSSPRLRLARLTATLALAWNPLLLLEACVNAHNDATILLLIMLACWLLLRWQRRQQLPWLLAATLSLALAACLKITFIVIFPGLLLFLLAREERRSFWPRLRLPAAILLTYVSCIVLLYWPFWHHGAVLRLLQVNPSASMARNTLYEFLVHLYATIAHIRLIQVNPNTGSQPEIVAHTIASLLFVLAYGGLCLHVLRRPASIRSLSALFAWMALAWLLFCCIGSTWFWPWYLVSWVGLSLLALVSDKGWQALLRSRAFAVTAALTAFCMLSIYAGYIWGMERTGLPFLPGLQISWLRGLWGWSFLLLVVPLALAQRRRQRTWSTLAAQPLPLPGQGQGSEKQRRGRLPVS